ncbi:MAG TPA: serine/threonine-protein kinase [Trebonia sp.]|nr:serine/threonine-protein kinase [Trebonia sp.]
MEELQAGDPARIGPYTLTARLGEGGMGQVFLGRSMGGRLVAVKVIRPELAHDRDFRARFSREVAVARTVGGFFTVPVVDADTEGPQPWLATGYVDGPALDAAVAERGPMTGPALLALAAGLAEGLDAIHAAGVVHRDLKPSNVLLAADGIRVIDFGIARAADHTRLTANGLVIGSPGFMSPEQAEGGEISPASDVFSLGAVVAYAATGEGPFGAGSAPGQLYRVVHGEPRLDGVPGALRSLVASCMDKAPGRRPSARQFLEELARLRDAAPPPAAGPPPAPAPATRTDRPRTMTVRRPARADYPPPPGNPVWRDPAPARETRAAAGTGTTSPGWRDDREPRRRRGRAIVGVVAALVLVIGGGAAFLALRHGQWQYYVAADGGHVAIYRQLGSSGQPRVVQKSTVVITQLPVASQAAVGGRIDAQNLASAESTVSSLRSDATACKREWQRIKEHPNLFSTATATTSAGACAPASAYGITL